MHASEELGKMAGRVHGALQVGELESLLAREDWSCSGPVSESLGLRSVGGEMLRRRVGFVPICAPELRQERKLIAAC